jgi:hypothetical protein
VLFVALAIIDYEFNNGRLIESLGGRATQFGNWLNDSLMSLVSYLAPNR